MYCILLQSFAIFCCFSFDYKRSFLLSSNKVTDTLLQDEMHGIPAENLHKYDHKKAAEPPKSSDVYSAMPSTRPFRIAKRSN